MEFLIILLSMVVVLDIAALRWGFDSTDGINSPEWERRQRWYASHSKNIVQAQFVKNVHLN